MPFNLTTFDAALQAKLNTASVSLSAQDYLLLTKAVQTAISVSEGVDLLNLKGTANGIAGLDSSAQVPSANLLNALPNQSGNNGKILTTNGTAASWTNTATLASLSTTGDLTSGDQLYVGSGASAFETSATLTSASAVFKKASAENSYSQIAFQNPTATSSTDIIAYMDNGVDADGWIDMGIAGSSFDDTTYGITNPGDGYIFVNTKTGKTGNMVFATGDNGTENKLVFAAGGFASGNTQMSITPDQNIHIEIPTPSTSATTGALTVVGGVGIQGDMNINGDVSIQGTITFGGGGTTVETANLAVTDPAVFVGTNNQADIVDLAFIGEYASSVSPIATTVNNKALTSNVATLTTSAAHNYLAGDVVTVTGVDATFNGTFNIIAVPTATTFTYAKTAANVTSAAVSPTGTATVNARRKFSGIARDASDGIIKAFKDATTKPTTTINFSEAGLAYADMRVGGLTADSLTVGNVSNTELGYLDGVTSSIQTQISAKAPSASPTFTGTVTVPATITSGSAVLTLPTSTSTIASTADITTALTSYSTTSTIASTYAPLVVTTSTPTFSSNNYTLVIGDAHKVLLASNSSTAGTITVPLNSSVAFATGTTITVTQTGSGQLTLVATGGVTINSYQSQLKLAGQYASVQLIKTGTDTWLAIGNLVA